MVTSPMGKSIFQWISENFVLSGIKVAEWKENADFEIPTPKLLGSGFSLIPLGLLVIGGYAAYKIIKK
jgi:hypothetical protein